MANKLEIAKEFFRMYPEGWVAKEVTHAGVGKWSIKVIGKYRDANGFPSQKFLFDVVGSIGTRNNEMADDLHQVVNDIIQTAVVN